MTIPGMPSWAMPDPAAPVKPPPPPRPGDPPFIQRMIDGALIVYPGAYYGWTDPGFDDALNINAALLQALTLERGGTSAPVRLAPYPFSTLSPVVLPGLTGSVLEGVVPVNADAGGQTKDAYGAVIAPTQGWAAPGGGVMPQPGLIWMSNGPGTSKVMRRPVIRNLWVDMSSGNLPAGTHGISAFGQVFHGLIEHVGVWGNPADATGDAIHCDQDPNGLPGPTRPDGWEFNSLILQSFGRYGHYWYGEDSVWSHVHAQAAPASTTDSGCFYLPKANDTRFSHCRADQGAYGWITDSNPGGVPNAIGGSILLDGCGSENVYHSALFLNNSSAGGTQIRTPVVAQGCSFDFAGRDLVSAAVLVAGANVLHLHHCQVNNGGQGDTGVPATSYPQVGLTTQLIGANGHPLLIEIFGGLWCCWGASMIPSPDPGGTLVLRYNMYGVAGGTMQGGIPGTTATRFQSATWP